MLATLTAVLLLQFDPCAFSSEQWQKSGVEAPCKVLRARDRRAAAMKAWKLTAPEAACIADVLVSRPDAGPALRDGLTMVGNHEVWKRCAEQWPTAIVFWMGAIESTPYRAPPVSVARLDGVDGGVALAERLLDVDQAPEAELTEVILREQPERLVELLGRHALFDVEAFKLALPRIERPTRPFTADEWDALGVAALEYALSTGHLQLAAETWLKLPGECRARLRQRPLIRRASPDEAGEPRADRRPALALALASHGKLDEARQIPRIEARRAQGFRALDLTPFADFIVHGVRVDAWQTALDTTQARVPGELLPLALDVVAPYEALLARDVRWFLDDARPDDELPPALQQRVAEHRATARVRLKVRAKSLFEGTGERDAGTVVLSPPPWPWTEGKAGGAQNQKTAEPRVAAFWPLRWEKQGARIVVLAASQRLDPTGEVSPGGFWLLVSMKNGPWREVYLGFSDHRPFTPRRTSKVPLLDAKDVVRVEVDEAPLDDESITFPPIGLRADTKRSGVVLQSTLAELTKDSDGDGLSDLVEGRLLLNPNAKDTDGDGVSDALDATPRLDDRLPPTVTAEALNAFFESTSSRDQPPALVVTPNATDIAGAVGRPRSVELDDVQWLVGTPGSFAGLTPLTRVITVSPAELEASRRLFGLWFPMDLQVYASTDGRHALIIWSERWRGGSARLDKDEKGVWQVTLLSSWIT